MIVQLFLGKRRLPIVIYALIFRFPSIYFLVIGEVYKIHHMTHTRMHTDRYR